MTSKTQPKEKPARSTEPCICVGGPWDGWEFYRHHLHNAAPPTTAWDTPIHSATARPARIRTGELRDVPESEPFRVWEFIDEDEQPLGKRKPLRRQKGKT
jgi:hypothetical protein